MMITIRSHWAADKSFIADDLLLLTPGPSCLSRPKISLQVVSYGFYFTGFDVSNCFNIQGKICLINYVDAISFVCCSFTFFLLFFQCLTKESVVKCASLGVK